MGLHPQSAALIADAEAAGGRPLEELSVLEARALDAGFLDMQLPPEDVAEVRDILVGGAAGMLPARLYHPAPGTALPILVFFHGGGFVVGNIDVSDRPCRAIANASGFAVISVSYRLSPETRFPGPVEDCYAATAWIAEHASEFGGDPSFIAVGGESAGGCLATVVSLVARDRGGPRLDYQALLYPVTAPARDTRSESYSSLATGYMLTRAAMEWFWDHYLADPADGSNPYASPLLAPDLAGLPPALVVTAEYDPLRDEGRDYASRLAEAGVPTIHEEYPGSLHGFLVMSARLDHGREVVTLVADALRGERAKHA